MKHSAWFLVLTLLSISFQVFSQGLAMVLVEGGSFTMGDTLSKSRYSRCEHEIIISPFYMGKYEITFEEYDAYCLATKKKLLNDGNHGRGKMPIFNVNWEDAIAYCNWLSKKEGLKPCYTIDKKEGKGKWKVSCDFSKDGYRLPTEAEWEYAARGGNKSKGFTYAGSRDSSLVAWYSLNSGGKSHPVGQKQPNELGIYDMSGNLWEWCWDFYEGDYYRTSPSDNPKGPETGVVHTLRGGSWYNTAIYLTTILRNLAKPDASNSTYGFRVVKKLKS
ncbi:MAG: SUMF1/EgtB/PvdO family nonheme iron enzyme [Bacteroidetes bacterium]|nr:SUMF1/EgtB/PvdO family nonheme iron enzyme [Bacteroidota bacterium]